MTYEEALKRANETVAEGSFTPEIQDYSFWYCVIEALEKQIPKKPKLNEDACGCRIDKTYSTDAHFCYNCNSYVPNYDYDKFCSACGQAIDWSDEE